MGKNESELLCLKHIGGGLSRQGSTVRALHLAEVLEMGADGSRWSALLFPAYSSQTVLRNHYWRTL